MAGVAIGAAEVYYIGTCVGTSVILLAEVTLVDLTSPKNCFWWFKNGCLYTAVMINSGFLEDYIVRLEELRTRP